MQQQPLVSLLLELLLGIVFLLIIVVIVQANLRLLYAGVAG